MFAVSFRGGLRDQYFATAALASASADEFCERNNLDRSDCSVIEVTCIDCDSDLHGTDDPACPAQREPEES